MPPAARYRLIRQRAGMLSALAPLRCRCRAPLIAPPMLRAATLIILRPPPPPDMPYFFVADFRRR
jgi:hypothetical protein